MSITKQELKKRLNGCQNVGEINAILQASGFADDVEISEEIANFVETVYALIKQSIPITQAIEYARTGEMPEQEVDIDSLLASQMEAGADYQNQVEAEILHARVTSSAKQYVKAYYSLFAAAVNSEVIHNDPEVVRVREAATQLILGDRIGSGGKNFLHRVVVGAASKNLLPQTKPALLLKQSDTK